MLQTGAQDAGLSAVFREAENHDLEGKFPDF
jgi:hypothetical protein